MYGILATGLVVLGMNAGNIEGNSMQARRVEARCPCSGEVVVEYKPAKWQGEEDKAIVTHKKWQEGHK